MLPGPAVDSILVSTWLQRTIPGHASTFQRLSDSSRYIHDHITLACRLLSFQVLLFFFLMFLLFIFERERVHEWVRGREREGQRILSGLCTDNSEPDVGLEPTNCEMMSWAEVGCSTEPPRRPVPLQLLKGELGPVAPFSLGWNEDLEVSGELQC